MQKHVNLVDLVKSFPTNIYLQNLASIQNRTSPIKFAHLAEESENGSISKLSTKVLRDRDPVAILRVPQSPGTEATYRTRTVVRSRDPTWDEVAAFELNWIERPEECLIEVHDDGPANELVFRAGLRGGGGVGMGVSGMVFVGLVLGCTEANFCK